MENVETKRKIKLKAPIVRVLKILGVILGFVLAIFFFYLYQISIFTNLGYSTKSANFILFNNLKSYVVSVGENKTLNKAFGSKDYDKENLEIYQNIKYVDQENFIKNINTLIKKGYSSSNINMIFAHGNSRDVEEFAKRDKIRYLEEFYSVPYAKLKYYDRYVAYSDETGEDDETTVLIVNLDLDKEDYTDPYIINKFSTTMLVNKHHSLTEDFVPNDLVEISKKYTKEDHLMANKEALDAYMKMSDAATKDGYGIVINSAYRSYQEQVELVEYYRNLYGDNYVSKYVALPGYSEHQTALGFDIGSTTTNVFINSKEYQWMEENAYKYGFILRYPKKYMDITGFNTEPWHYRYVGIEIADYIHEHDMSYEEYYASFLDD